MILLLTDFIRDERVNEILASLLLELRALSFKTEGEFDR